MDTRTYASATDMCGRLAGRLSDDTLGTIREYYAAGEWDLADATLLLNLAYEDVGVTDEERDLIRSFLGDPESPDLLDIPAIGEVPLRHRFTDAPANAPEPARADALLSTEALRHNAGRVTRAWREPLDGVRDGATWVYMVEVAEGADELKVYSGLPSRLWIALKEKWGGGSGRRGTFFTAVPSRRIGGCPADRDRGQTGPSAPRARRARSSGQGRDAGSRSGP